MKTHQEHSVQRRSMVAIQAALLAMAVVSAARAEEDVTVAELTTPVKQVEVGILNVSRDSFKFGEYNGLERGQVYGVLNFNLNGNGGDDSTLRWSALGNDLGNDSRRFEAQGGYQGSFNLRFLYDELPHRISDSYRTIFNGAGSTSLTLPGSYPAIGTRLSSTSSDVNALANWGNIQAPNAVSGIPGGGPGYLIPSLMHDQDIGTDRKKLGAGGTFILAPGWELTATAQKEEKKGTKLTGYAFGSASTATMLAEPIDFNTNNYGLSLVYMGDKANAKIAYNYSAFTNGIGAWTAQTPFATGSVINNQAMLSSAPENQMHQINVAGGYRFTPSTRLTYELTKSRMTQDSRFNYQNGAGWSVPVTSANAKVLTDMYFVKFSSRPVTGLSLNASYKHDSRDNQTPVRTFTIAFADSSGATSPITNDPINSTKNLLDLNGEYAFSRAQVVRLGFQREGINGTTDGNGYAPSRTQATANTNDFSLPVAHTTEKIWNIEYRNTMIDNLSGRIAFTESRRNADDFRNPTLADTNATTALTNPYYRSFHDFFVADRTRRKVRGSLEYQVSDTVGLNFGLDYNRDNYDDAALDEVKSTIFNFDVSYSPSANLSITPYYTYEDRKTRLDGKYVSTSTTAGTKLNGMALLGTAWPSGAVGGACNATATAACVVLNGNWSLTQADRVDTFGIGMKQKDLMAGKLELSGDLLYILSRTPVTASGSGSVVSDGAAAPNFTSLSALNFPEINSRTLRLNLVGNYKLDKQQTVRVSYLFQRLVTNDWQYDAYTNPVTTQAYIGTGMTSPDYTVNAIGISYIRTF